MADLSFSIDANTAPAQAQVVALGRTFDELGEDMLRIVDAGKRAGQSNEEIARDLARVYDVPLDNARRGVDQLDDLLREAGRTGSRAADDIKTGLQDVATKAKEAGDNVDRIGGSGSSGFGRLGSVARDVSQDLGQGLRGAADDAAAGFSNLGSVGQNTLGDLAGTVAGFGPAGIIGALGLGAGAAIWGSFIAGQEEAREKQEEVNAAGARFAQAYQDGLNGAISSASIFAEINAIATDPDRYTEATTNAKNWGVENQTALQAMAGDSLALAAVRDSLTQKENEWNDSLSDREQSLNGIGGAMTTTNAEVEAGYAALDLLSGSLEMGSQRARDAAAAAYEFATANGLATGKTDDLGNAIVRLPDGKEVVVNAQTQQAYADIDTFEDRQIPAKEFTVKARLDSSEVDNWNPPLKEVTALTRLTTRYDG